ncbi:DoxX family protein [Tropicimonas sp. IMCC34011]|uniref:DoxX family protein n=1 Tax=Tropicimonas sp. IMCC34011 TaxID=2248759 RepID=UPI000E22D8D0|nr:DoxX family protein [Tropicimonas sp. IMCC34011]
MSTALTAHAPKMLSVLRIVSALIFLAHGTQKLLNFPASDMNPPLLSMFGIAGLIELVGGILLLIGLFTRPVAFICSGLMAAAYFIAHAPQSAFPSLNGGDAAILYCFVFLYFVFSGPGVWSVDAARSKSTLA